MKFVIRTDIPFPGYAQSVLKEDGTVAWSDGMTLEQYAVARGFPVRVVDEDEMRTLVEEHADSRITAPEPITAEQWEDMLNVLPPSRWHRHDGVEMFHVSERITHDLVNWFAKVGDRHFGWVGRSGTDSATLAAAVSAALAKVDKSCAG